MFWGHLPTTGLSPHLSKYREVSLFPFQLSKQTSIILLNLLKKLVAKALKRGLGDFPVGPVVKALWSHCAGGVGSIPGQGTKIPHAVQCGQEQQKKRMGN